MSHYLGCPILLYAGLSAWSVSPWIFITEAYPYLPCLPVSLQSKRGSSQEILSPHPEIPYLHPEMLILSYFYLKTALDVQTQETTHRKGMKNICLLSIFGNNQIINIYPEIFIIRLYAVIVNNWIFYIYPFFFAQVFDMQPGSKSDIPQLSGQAQKTMKVFGSV